MNKYYNRLIGELKKFTIEKKRYFNDTIFSILGFTFGFMMMSGIMKSFTGGNTAELNIDGFLLGYSLFMFAVMNYTSFSGSITEEMSRGTLEQLYLSSISIQVTLIYKTIINFIYNLLLLAITLFTIKEMTGITIQIDYLRALLILFISVPALWGLGLIISVIVLSNRKISGVMGILQFGFFILIALPAEPFTKYSFLPFTTASNLIFSLSNPENPLPLVWYLFVIANSIIYLTIGFVAYGFFERNARKKNILCQY